MKTSYTPGPWEIDPQLHVQDALGRALFYSQNSGYSQHPTEKNRLQMWERTDDERSANAKLIAAAPELAETLYEVSMAIQSMRLSQIAVVVAKALAVLDKAGVKVEIPEYLKEEIV